MTSSGAATRIWIAAVAPSPIASVARSVAWKSPVSVATPRITPSSDLSANPVGSRPRERLHRTGGVPSRTPRTISAETCARSSKRSGTGATLYTRSKFAVSSPGSSRR